MEARLAGTGSLSQLASEPGDPVGESVPGRGEWLGAKREGEREGTEDVGHQGKLPYKSWWTGSQRRSHCFMGFSLGGLPGRGRVRQGRLELYCGGKKLLVCT